MNREYTNEEALYRRLMFAYNHYEGGGYEGFNKNRELLEEVRASKTLAEDFKQHFEGLWFDQTSKLFDIADMQARTFKEWFKELGFEARPIK